jgi:hypothetical protein
MHTTYSIFTAVFAFLAVFPGQASGQTEIDFTGTIRPILADKCFTCHGPDPAQRKAGLRLDLKESAMAPLASGAIAIVPGSPTESALLKRITSDDVTLKMPPPEAENPLTQQEIESLQSWLAEGAPWEEHWAFVPPVRPDPPPVEEVNWPRGDLDRFVLGALEASGLSPSAEADRETLIRRVTLDLTGLPPTINEINAFLYDSTPQAYERVVDRLLATSRYGEHMAHYWLDAARYGDTHGMHLDNYREIWPYRDWVISALNQNIPFDQFITEQLAGDLLPDPSTAQIIATGFNRCNVSTNEGGSIAEEVYVRNVVDRVVTTGTVFLGLTLDCTRCHDHKYDPLTMNDFYSLFAYFNSIDGKPLDGNRKDHAPVMKVVTEQQQQTLTQLNRKIQQLETRLQDDWELVDRQQQIWEQQFTNAPAADVGEGSITLNDWYVVGPFKNDKRYLFVRQQGPEIQLGKTISLAEEFSLATGEKVSWKRHPEWKDGKVHTVFSQELAAHFLVRIIHSSRAQKLDISLGSDDAIKVYLNGTLVLKNDVSRTAQPDQQQVALDLVTGENHLLIKLINYLGHSGFYFKAAAGVNLPTEIRNIAQQDPAQRDEKQRAELRQFYRFKVSPDEDLAAALGELTATRKQHAELDASLPTTLIWRERAEPKPAYYLVRGSYDQKGAERPRDTPAILPPMNKAWPSNRLGLARWLTDPGHPLTARVTVNRLWQQLFGTGLVKTVDDFGTRSERPSHPKLLDWLAVDFIESDWNLQSMMKQLVMSATYRQASDMTSEALSRDPENRLLSRGSRFRLDAEMLRDQALMVSGLLVEKLGGPSVKPPQPDGLWFAVGYSDSNTVRFIADKTPEGIHRRSLYTFVKRTSPPPQMSTFDGPSREACSVHRERTNTPLQALLLLNDPQFVDAARALALRTLVAGGQTDRDRANFMFRTCTGRHPTIQELNELVEAVKTDRDYFAANLTAAQSLAHGDSTTTNSVLQKAGSEAGETDIETWAAWTVAANLLLNLDEVVTKN